jgi:hypothetical protein
LKIVGWIELIAVPEYKMRPKTFSAGPQKASVSTTIAEKGDQLVEQTPCALLHKNFQHGD